MTRNVSFKRPTKGLFEAATKKTFKPTKEHQNLEENLCLIDKIIGTLFKYWSSQMEKIIVAAKISLLT